MNDSQQIDDRVMEDNKALEPVVMHLSGQQRGHITRLSGQTVSVAVTEAADVQVVRPQLDRHPAGEHAATLHPDGNTYEIASTSDKRIWVNGDAVQTRQLNTGDVIEVEGGRSLLRYRIYPPGHGQHKSIPEVFSDCVECVRHEPTRIGKINRLLTGITRDLLTQTSLRFRASVVIALIGLGALVWFNAISTSNLERRLSAEQDRVAGLQSFIEQAGRQSLTHGDLDTVRKEISLNIKTATQRIDALEAKSVVMQETIARTLPSVVFILGSFGFEDQATQRPLRYVTGPGDMPMRMPNGNPAVTLEGDGPPIEVTYTGTAFIARADGLLLTNRHVAIPGENEAQYSEITSSLGLLPVMRKLIGYLPGESQSFKAALVQASDAADIAILKSPDIAGKRPPLKIRQSQTQTGDEVLVIGYPTGIRALLARAGEKFVKTLSENDAKDFWQISQRLADDKLITPLVSRGIIGQSKGEFIAYDAETTMGGSGGPVLLLDGDVIAVNTAVFREFGGANMGVPISHGISLLGEVD